MIGISFLIGILMWVTLAVTVSTRIPRWTGITKHTTVVSALIFPLVLAAPIADDLIGRWQFYRLCAREAVVTLSPDWEKVKRAKWESTSERKVSGYAYVIPIRRIDGGYVNSDTGEVFLRSNSFLMHGGFITRWLGPLWGNATFCYAKDLQDIETKVNITGLLKQGESK